MKILQQTNPENVVFIDIETVPVVPELIKDTELYDSWKYKIKNEHNYPKDSPLLAGFLKETYLEKAALYPEYAKIACITIGKITNKDELTLHSIGDKDEAVVLKNFAQIVTGLLAKNKQLVLCGHAIKGFDIPFLLRRCIINQIVPPSLIDVAHLKPWEQSSLDLLELWKAGGFNSAPLIAIAVALGLPSPKDEMAGYDSAEVFYNEEDGVGKLVRYCEKDVTTAANIFRKCRFEGILTRPSAHIAAEIIKEDIGVLSKVFNTEQYTKADYEKVTEKYQNLDENEKEKAKIIIETIIPKS